MGIRDSYDVRFLLAAVLALPLVIAIAIPLYLSGTPALQAQSSQPLGSPIPAVDVAAASTRTLFTTSPVVATATAVPTVVPTATATMAPPAPQNETVVAVVEELLAGQDGVFGVVIERPGEDPEYSLNAGVPFLAASLYKLVLLADVYDAIERGVLSTDTELELFPEYFPAEGEPVDSYFDVEMMSTLVTVGDALFATGAFSSNVAAHALLSLTDEISLEATARTIGMNHTYFYVDPRDLPDWPPTASASTGETALDEAVSFAESQADIGPLMLTTPRDIAIYFNKLLAGQVVDANVSQQILEILKQQAVDDRFPCLLPFGTEMAHKTGNIDHVVHDAGIIWAPDGPIILIAMIEDSPDDATATLIIQQLALIAYFEGEIPATTDQATPSLACGSVPVE